MLKKWLVSILILALGAGGAYYLWDSRPAAGGNRDGGQGRPVATAQGQPAADASGAAVPRATGQGANGRNLTAGANGEGGAAGEGGLSPEQRARLTDEQKKKLRSLDPEQRVAYLKELGITPAPANGTGQRNAHRRAPSAAFQLMQSMTGSSRFNRGSVPAGSITQVEVVEVKLARNAPELPLLATVHAKRIEEIRAPRATRVKEVLVRLGESVEQGTALLNLDAKELAWSLREREASIEQLEAVARIAAQQHQANLAALRQASENHAREKKLLAQGHSNVNNLQNAVNTLRSAQLEVDLYGDESSQRTAQLKIARVALEQVRDQLEEFRPVAPFSGEVVRLDAAAGVQFSANQVLLTLVDLDSLYVEGQLPISVYRKLRGVTIPASLQLEGERYALTLDNLSTQSVAGSVDITFRIGKQIPVVLGETVELWLRLPAVSSYAVPTDSVYYGNQLFLIREGRLVPAAVEVVGHQSRDGVQWSLVTGSALIEPVTVLATRLSRPTSGTPVQVLGSHR